MGIRTSLTASAALAAVATLPQAARAHGGVELHVGTDYESCYFDLHPELTNDQFEEFAGEGGQIIRSRQLSSADTLGKGVFDVSLGYARFFLDDEKGAWNNTMSHPDEEHYLGDQLGFPQLSVRAGVSDDVDAEVYGTVNWMSNYGFVGGAAKIRLLDQDEGRPISLAVRPSLSAMLGPSEVQVVNASTDVTVSHRFGGLTPFAGATLSATAVAETSSDTDVDPQVAFRPLAFAGVEYRWRALSAAAQAEIADLAAFGLRVGGRF
jgi:hypothetical protein